MQYKNYRASINYDGDDNIFWGEVIGINDVITFHGSTVEELEEHFRTRIDDYLEFCRQIGKEPEKEYSGSFNIRIKPECHKEASLCAASLKMSLNQYIGTAIAYYNSKILKEAK